jgi:hypothetical protein
MAKRAKRAKGNDPEPDSGTSTMGADALEQRVVAFAEQLGRMAGTVQAKAESLLSKKPAPAPPTAAAPTTRSRGKVEPRSRGQLDARGRGQVDAPGKKHRKPTPKDPAVRTATNRMPKMRTAGTKVATSRRRGRG